MAGTVTVTKEQGHGLTLITVAWVGDASDGSVPATVLPAFKGLLHTLETDPGATAPTINYDITIVDANGHDVLEGVGANRSNTATEKSPISFTIPAGTDIKPPVVRSDVLTFTLVNNSVVSATGVAKLYVQQQ